MGQRSPSWRTALIGIVVIKAVLSLAVKPGSFIVSYSGISYFLLLLLATTFAIRNGIQNTLGSRIFWYFLATGCGLWALNQYLQVYYELGLHIDVPQTSISDTLLFLHVVPLMAVVTALPCRDGTNRRLSRVVWESILLLFFWTFLYAHSVFPYQYLYPTSSYGVRFDILYLSANLVLVLATGISALRLKAPWRQICLQLFGASFLYSLGSAFANLAIDSGGYVNGKLYGLCLTASVCWFVWIPLEARSAARREATTVISDDGRSSQLSLWAMGMVVMISIPIVWELLQRNENSGLRTFRLATAVAIIVCLASADHVMGYLDRHELASDVRIANDRLRSGEELLRVFVKNVPAAVAMLDRNMRYLQVSDRWCTDYLSGRQQILGRSHYEIFPDMPERWKEVHRRALQGETLRADEDRWDGQDGPHWARWEVRPWNTPEGAVGGVLILAEDITRRKQIEEELSDLSRKLIESQEQDRARIGRDLHDDINQQLALLAIDIEQLSQHPPDSAAEIGGELTQIRDRITAIAADVQSISHHLHSPQLEILGIVAAIRGFCREFAAHQKVTVDFTHDTIPKGVSHEVSLCLFRVLQEALHNAIKHSNVRHYEVRLGCSASELHLTVSDRGTGFMAETAMSSGGLGLISMRERVRLVNGTIVVDSKPQRGTSIRVRVPLPSEQGSERAAG